MVRSPPPGHIRYEREKKGNKKLNQSYTLKTPSSLHRPSPELIPTDEDFLDFVNRELPFLLLVKISWMSLPSSTFKNDATCIRATCIKIIMISNEL